MIASSQAPQISAFDAALALLDQIKGHIESDPTIARSQLDELRTLLTLARTDGVKDAKGEKDDTGSEDALRAKLDATVQETASFASLMVHEIRKPMTSIRGYIDMLAKPGMVGPLNEMQTQFVSTIRTNAIRMEGLVADISDISKLNSGRLRLEAKMTTFGQVVMDVQRQADALIAEYGQTVNWDIPQGLPFLNTDAKQLAKVLFYLLRNAIQYAPKGIGQITVKAETTEPNTLHVTITDNGIGMSAEEIARLGELFYRADNELVSSERGYGLGIPIAERLLKLMGGGFDAVKSETGKGSTFGFTLPGMVMT